MSASPTFDFAVIGGGSAGYAAARTAVSLGLKTVVVDGADRLGGLCILRGCMPSKTLIESANRNLSIRRASEFGLNATPGSPNMRVIRDRKRVLIDDFAGYRDGQLKDGRFTLLRGHANFASANELEVSLREGGTERVIFRTACIATGSVVSVPPIPGLVESGFWTSDDVLDADSLPESMIVLGGGAIALEMAHFAEAMGSRVTLIQRSERVLSFMDPECGDTVEAAFRHRGMSVHCGTKLRSIERTASGKRITFDDATGTHSAEAAEILVATGREPNTGALGLDAAGIELLGKKIKVNGAMQSSQPHIFGAGDVCSELDVVHIAIQQGEIVAHNAAALIRSEEELKTMDYRSRLFGVFCQPQIACVGMTEHELKETGVHYLTASYPFNDHGKSMVMGETEGFVKLIADKHAGVILGGTVVGPEATELIHEIVVAMQFRGTVKQLAATPHYHPTLSEIWTYPAEELADTLGL